jgi:hypothetical protein
MKKIKKKIVIKRMRTILDKKKSYEIKCLGTNLKKYQIYI